MSTTDRLKQIWKNTVASCFSNQPAREGDEPTNAPVEYGISSHQKLSAPALKVRADDEEEPAENEGTRGGNEDSEDNQDGNRTQGQVDDQDAGLSQDQMDNHKQAVPDNQITSYDQDVTRDANGWTVPGVGHFVKRAVYTFDGDQLPTGLQKSDYTVECKAAACPDSTEIPYNQRYDPDNVQLSNGFLTLTVPGRQTPENTDNMISCAEVTTMEDNILFGSVRTYAVFSKVPGTCHGIFFYRNDSQEIDIEYLTDPRSLSNNGPKRPIPIWYTNQAVSPATQGKTAETGAAPKDCTTDVHEYRIDWTKYFTAFYLDGVLQRKYVLNLPSTPGPWVWNNWANGDIGWSVGPPAKDNVFKIQKIIMYYNTAMKKGQS